MQEPEKDSLLKAVQDLLTIESTAHNMAGLRQAYEYMRAYLLGSSKAITIEEFESGGKPSLLAYRGEARPDRFRIILNAHLDVVTGQAEQFKPYIEDGRLYGRGAYDMKAAAVIMTQVFCEYVDKLPYALGLQLVTDEESGGALGTKYQVEQGLRADFILCGECGRIPGTFEIAHEAKGIAILEVQFKGSTTHGAYPWQGSNAALKAATFMQKLHELFPVPEAATNGTTLTVTSIVTSPTSDSQTPEFATLRLDCRYAPGDTRFSTVSAMAALIHSIDAEATIAQVLSSGPPMHTEPDNPLLLELKAAAEEVEHHEFSLVRRNGTSDGRFYTDVGGQACEFGIAGEYQHGAKEYIPLAAFDNYLKTMRSFLEKTVTIDPHTAL